MALRVKNKTKQNKKKQHYGKLYMCSCCHTKKKHTCTSHTVFSVTLRREERLGIRTTLKHKHLTFHAGNVPVLDSIICTKQWCAWIERWIWPLFISANPDVPFPVLTLFHRIFSFAQKHQMAPCLSNVSGCFLSGSLPDTPLPPNYSFWVWVRSPLPHWHYGFITPLCIACLPACLPACLAWAWT